MLGTSGILRIFEIEDFLVNFQFVPGFCHKRKD